MTLVANRSCVGPPHNSNYALMQPPKAQLLCVQPPFVTQTLVFLGLRESRACRLPLWSRFTSCSLLPRWLGERSRYHNNQRSSSRLFYCHDRRMSPSPRSALKPAAALVGGDETRLLLDPQMLLPHTCDLSPRSIIRYDPGTGSFSLRPQSCLLLNPGSLPKARSSRQRSASAPPAAVLSAGTSTLPPTQMEKPSSPSCIHSQAFGNRPE